MDEIFASNSNQYFKSKAREVLKRSYWTSFFALLILGILSSVYMLGSYLPITAMYVTTIKTISLTILFLVSSLVYTLLVGYPLQVGEKRFLMLNRYYRADLKEIFSGFRAGKFFNRIKVLFLRDLFCFLWLLPAAALEVFLLIQFKTTPQRLVNLVALLPAIPAFIKMYSYFMIPYILAGNSAITAKRAFEISVQTMKGEKFNLFTLRISFIGWYYLSNLLCGIGVLFLNPYIKAAEAEFYDTLRQKAIRLGICTKEELDADIAGHIEAYEQAIAMERQARTAAFQLKEVDTKPCPFCGVQLSGKPLFCPYCGGNIIEKESETKKARLEELEQNGIKALLDDKELYGKASMLWRSYGIASCISFLKGQAKELGLQDIEITEEDVKNLLEEPNEQ